MQVDGALVISYFLQSSEQGHVLVVRGSVVPKSANDPVEAPSVAEIWPSAKPMEDESAMLFGIVFGGRKPAGHDFPLFPMRHAKDSS
jgi:NADH:ubiquinone oxidoreductase subunit C